MPLFVNIFDFESLYKQSHSPTSQAHPVGSIDFDQLLDKGDPSFELLKCRDEFDAITLNYTSGTTGLRKLFYFLVFNITYCSLKCERKYLISAIRKSKRSCDALQRRLSKFFKQSDWTKHAVRMQVFMGFVNYDWAIMTYLFRISDIKRDESINFFFFIDFRYDYSIYSLLPIKRIQK